MPVYEYKCTVCEQHMDVEQSFSDDALTTLPGCEVHKSGKHQLKKVFSAVGISFKGDGFYRNDARSGSKASTGKSTESSSTSSDSSSSGSSESSSGNGSGSSKATKADGSSSSGNGSGSSKASAGSSSSS